MIIGKRLFCVISIVFLLVLAACEEQPTTPTEAPVAEVEVEPTEEPTGTSEPTNTPAPTDTVKPTETTEPTDTPAPTDTAEPTLAHPPGETATVVGIVDGDTIDVELDGQEYRVRYIGIDTTERGEDFYNQSTEANVELVEGETVVLVKDVSETDQFGRLLRYVYLEDGTFVNAELVRNGFAFAATFPPDVRHQELFSDLQAEAREANVGLWAIPAVEATATSPAVQATETLPPATATLAATPTLAPPTPTIAPPTATTAPPTATAVPPTPTIPPPTATANCSAAYPDFCIPPPPPDLDCGDINASNFTVLPPDPHGFDGDGDGVGCES